MVWVLGIITGGSGEMYARATGHSDKNGMTYRLAAQGSELFQAIGMDQHSERTDCPPRWTNAEYV